MFYILPVLLLTTFKLIHFNEIICPYETDIYNTTNMTLMNSYNTYEYELSDHNDNLFLVKGNRCSKVIARTRCKLHLFGSNDVIKETIFESATEEECKNENKPLIQYPDENCIKNLFSNDYHIEESTYIVNYPQSYYFDPVQNRLKDESIIFEKKIGNSYIYRGNKGIWIAKDYEHKLKDCSTYQEIPDSSLTIKIYSYLEKNFIEINNHLYEQDDLCFYESCGTALGRTIHNIVFKLPPSLKLKKCQGRLMHHNTLVELTNLKKENEQCVNIRMKALVDKKIQHKDLIHMIPFSRGVHPIYKMNNESKLMMALAEYKEHPVLTKDFDTWGECGNNTYCGYNGNTKIRSDQYNIKLKDVLSHHAEIENGLYIIDEQKHLDNYISEATTHYQLNNFLLTFLVDQWKWFAEILLLLIILYFIYKKLKSCCCKNKKYNHHNQLRMSDF